MPTLKPTLYIGIGSTGAEILGHLQELIVEEYLTPNFPTIRLLSLISSENDRHYLRHSNQNECVHLTIPNVNVIRDDVRNPNDPFSRLLASWVPNELFGLNVQAFNQGANNMRVAGRLLLWKHYQTIRNKIDANIKLCSSNASLQEATRILNQLGRGNMDGGNGAQPSGMNVFIVGSLCGGTCSGMFWELGYLARSVCQGAELIGVFSVMDGDQARDANSSVVAANCHAALREFDSLCSEDMRELEIVHPDGTRLVNQIPYNYLYLLSTKSISGYTVSDREGQPDHRAVNRMIAQTLFLESYAETHLTKQHIRSKWSAVVNIWDPDPINRNPRAYFTFGCSLVKYPKYSIASAAASRLAQKLCQTWIRENGQVADPINEKFIKDVKITLMQLDKMVDTNQSISSIIEAEVNKVRLFDSKSEVICKILPFFPDEKDPLDKRFISPGGIYYVSMDKQSDEIKAQLNGLVNDYVNDLRTRQKWSLPDVLNCIEVLKEKVNILQEKHEQKAKKSCFDLAPLGYWTSKLKRVENDFWINSFLLRKNAIDQTRREIKKTYIEVANEAVKTLKDTFSEKLYKYTISMLDELYIKLSKEMKIISELADPDNDERGYFYDESKKICDYLRNPPQYIMPVYSDGAKNIDEEINNLCHSLSFRDFFESAIQAITPNITVNNQQVIYNDFSLKWTNSLIKTKGLGQEPHIIIGKKIINALTIEVLIRIGPQPVDVLNKAFASPNDLNKIVRHAAPLLEFTESYLQGAGNRLRPPVPGTKYFVFGSSPDNRTLKNQFDDSQGYRIPQLPYQDDSWDFKALSPGLSHYLIFYREEAYFSTTYIESAKYYRNAYKNKRDSLRWTDKRWWPDGPPIGDLARTKYLEFLFEYSVNFLRGSISTDDGVEDDITGRLFRVEKDNRRLDYFFEVKVHNRPPMGVQKGNRANYREMAKPSNARIIIPQFTDKLTSVMRALQTTPQRSQEEFDRRYRMIRREIDQKYNELNIDHQSKAELDEEYKNEITQLDAYYFHVRELTWGLIPNDSEKAILCQLSWLTNWAREDY